VKKTAHDMGEEEHGGNEEANVLDARRDVPKQALQAVRETKEAAELYHAKEAKKSNESNCGNATGGTIARLLHDELQGEDCEKVNGESPSEVLPHVVPQVRSNQPVKPKVMCSIEKFF